MTRTATQTAARTATRPAVAASAVAATRSPLLRVEHLAVGFTQYGRGLDRRVVRPVVDMSVSVDAGEVVALVGASGAGKSLLAHAVLGLLPPNAHESGTVSWRGQELTARERARLAGREVALLPQSLSHLDPTATVGSQLRRSFRLAGRSRAQARAAAVEAVAEQGLDEHVLRRYPHQLSGGMGRRVLTAMALAGDPALVVADEPTPGLTADSVRAVLDRLRGLADAGRGVLVVTHELSGVLAVADRVVVCERGRTLEEAPAAAFTGTGDRLAHPYSRALWRALPTTEFRTDDTFARGVAAFPVATVPAAAC